VQGGFRQRIGCWDPRRRLKADPMVYEYRNTKAKANRRLAVLIGVMVILASFLAAYTAYDYIRSREKPKISSVATTQSISIFVPAEHGRLAEKKLEARTDMSERQKADTIVNALQVEKCLPEGLTLYDFAVGENGVVYLNFSKEIQSGGIGTGREITMVYAIVDSFVTNFRNANSVQIIAEGQPIRTIGGLIYAYKPIEFNKGLLED
jgi:hypothetical protein